MLFCTRAKTMQFFSPTMLFFILLSLAIPTLLNAQPEILCSNGIDDDADGLIDCTDPDCWILFRTISGSMGDSYTYDAQLGDLDGDGDLDAFVANFRQANRVWINQGGDQGGTAGSYIDSGQLLDNTESWKVALGDLDGDGDLDAFVANAPLSGGPSGGFSHPGFNTVWINQGGDQGGGAGFFTNSGQELGTNESHGVSLGDVDNDGDIDAFVANSNQPNRLWINQGGDQGGTAGEFLDSGQALGNFGSEAVVLADLDGDRDLDAYVANYQQPDRVWINQGGDQGGSAGTFLDSMQELENNASYRLALGDLDNDGDLDAFVAVWGSYNSIWVNQGGDQGGTAGNFATDNQTPGNFHSTDVALADVDGDGDLAGFVSNYEQPNRVWINQGGDQKGPGIPGEFLDSTQELGTSFSNSITLADLDGDGDFDAFVGNDEPNRVWFNQGGDQQGTLGVFIDNSDDLGDSVSGGIAIGDLDSDGDLDAFVANYEQPNRVWLNDGLGSFFDDGQLLGSSSSWDVDLGDLDGDGDLDAIVANWRAQGVGEPNHIWINQGGLQGGTEGFFVDSGQQLGSSCSLDVALADFDQDGDLDAYVANEHPAGSCGGNSPPGPNLLWINQGGNQGGTQGLFLDSGQQLGNSYSEGMSHGDLDGDGDIDVFCANWGSNTVWINQGGDQGGTAGEFSDNGQQLGAAVSYGVDLGDVDGDGHLDAWVVNNGEPNRVWLNDGTGIFTDSGQELAAFCSYDVDLGDFDGDGDLDAFVTNIYEPNRIWINQGGFQGGTAGNFIDSGLQLDAFGGYKVALEDLNGDFILDAFVVTPDSHLIYFQLSRCSIPFKRGDVNGDGFVDIADAIAALSYLFGQGTATCLDALDSNDSSMTDIGDVIHILGFLFSGESPQPDPGNQNCGLDPTDDALDCVSYDGC